MEKARKGFLIGRIAKRTGTSVSALRFYEEKGLIQSGRDNGGRRIFAASDIRRVSFIMIAQKLGFSLSHIKDILGRLPDGRTPTKQDWEVLSRDFSRDIDDRIKGLLQLKEKLTSCIGCGCLSLTACALYNTDDIAEEKGSGPRFLMGDSPKVVDTF